VAMKARTTHQKLLRARHYVVLLGLAGALGLEVFVNFELHHHSPLEMPVFLLVFGIFIALGAWVTNALRCPKCSLHLSYCKNAPGRDLHSCPKCGANFNVPVSDL